MPRKAPLLDRLWSAHECMVKEQHWLAPSMREAIQEIERLSKKLHGTPKAVPTMESSK